MKNIVLSFFLIQFFQVAFGQNLISNSSFENKSNNPTSIAQTDFIIDWYNAQKIKEKNNLTYYLHSPEFFYIDSHSLYFKERNNNGQVFIVPAADGECYIGMSHAELLGTKLDNAIIKSVEHNISLSFWITKSPVMGFYPYFEGFNPYASAKLNVYISKTKLKYTDYKIDDICIDSRYDDFNSNSNNYKLIMQVPLDGISFEPQKWYKVMSNFSVGEAGYNWIVVELDVDNNHCEQYVLIDDINLVNYCINGCSGTDGKTDIAVNQMHRVDEPLTFFGLDNVSFADLTIYQDGAIVNQILLQNPPSIIAWDGKVNGAETSAGTYEYKLAYTNDCGTFYLEHSFVKINGPQEPTLPNEYFNYFSVSKPPKQCCLYNPDIVIQNQNLVQDQTILISQANPAPLIYKAVRSIVAGPAVNVLNQPVDNTVVFEAGEFIDLLPGFETQIGSDFTAQIAPCNTQDPIIILDSKSIAVDSDGKESEYYYDEDTLVNNSVFSVVPNPFESEFVFSIMPSDSATIKSIEIVTASGQTVFMVADINQSAFVVNAEEWSNGLYFTRALLSNGEVLCTKIIKSKP